MESAVDVIMDESQRNPSVRLYEALEEVGASEDIRHIHNENVVSDIIESVSKTIDLNVPVHIYTCGSWCEGTTTPGMGSDIDVLIVADIPVNVDISEAGYGLSLLMVKEVHTQPGYFKLQFLYNRVPLTVCQVEVPPNCDTDKQGRICFKHYVHPGDERHGPADTDELGNGILNDKVFALRCTRIPEGYTEWIHRRRRYGFPSKELLERMAKLSCFVVGIGHERSDEQHIEWRLSLSLQERKLMLSLNPVQHKCYILLKMIKKDIIQPFIGDVDVISSYHCKTCLFYAIEDSPPDLWTPENLVPCLFRCLNILFECVQTSNCPNYFMSTSNMFDRIRFRETRENILQILHDIFKIGPNILFRFKIGNIGNTLVRGITFNKTKQVSCRYDLYLFLLNNPLYFSRVLLTYSFSHNASDQTTSFLLQLLVYLQTSFSVRDYTEHQTSEAFSYLIPRVHQRLAMVLASKAMKTNHEPTARQLLSWSDVHFRQGLATDLMNTRLLFVAVLYKLGKYQECGEILEKLDLELTRHTASVCCCYSGQVINNDLANKITDKNLSVKQIMYSEVVSCITFLPSEVVFVPPPLQYEMHRSEGTPPGSRDEKKDIWFNWAVVDAKVFLFFMQYLVFTKLDFKANKEVAIQNLEWVMTGDIRHIDTAYNLLGWIHLQEHRLEEAVRCWGKSLAIRPQHNAAKFHVSDLMYNIQAAMND